MITRYNFCAIYLDAGTTEWLKYPIRDFSSKFCTLATNEFLQIRTIFHQKCTIKNHEQFPDVSFTYYSFEYFERRAKHFFHVEKSTIHSRPTRRVVN